MFKSIVYPQFFIYVIPLQNILPNTIVTPQINISNDSDFMLFELRAITFPSDQQTRGVSFQLSLAGGELFSNGGVELMSFASNQDGSVLHQDVAGYPIRFPESIRIPANSTLNVQLQNNDPAVTAFNVQVQFWGYKVEKK